MTILRLWTCLARFFGYIVALTARVLNFPSYIQVIFLDRRVYLSISNVNNIERLQRPLQVLR